MDPAQQIMDVARDVGLSGELLDMFYEEFDLTEWSRFKGRAYPPYYAYALGRYRVNPAAVEKMRRAIRTVPRVDPEDYDILFNVEGGSIEFTGPSWDIVKWVAMPELSGIVPGAGFMTSIVWEPYPIYHFPAHRDPMSLGDEDWMHLFHYANAIRGGDAIDQEIRDANEDRLEEKRRRRADEDLAFAEHNRDRFKTIAEERGI